MNLLHETVRERERELDIKEREKALFIKEKDHIAKWKRDHSDKNESRGQDSCDKRKKRKTEENNTHNKRHLEDKGVCYNCQKPGHIAKNCRRTTVKCYSCGKYSNHQAEAEAKAIRLFKKGNKLGGANFVDSQY